RRRVELEERLRLEIELDGEERAGVPGTERAQRVGVPGERSRERQACEHGGEEHAGEPARRPALGRARWFEVRRRGHGGLGAGRSGATSLVSWARGGTLITCAVTPCKQWLPRTTTFSAAPLRSSSEIAVRMAGASPSLSNVLSRISSWRSRAGP